MTDFREHSQIPMLKQQFAEGQLDRREFLRYSTLLGLSATAAYAFVGKVTGTRFVAPARAASMPKGGTLRISHRVHEMHNPHAYNWSQPGSISMNVVNPLAYTHQDGVTRPGLAGSWEASDDLKVWTFHLRENATWRKGGKRVSAEEVVANFKHILDPETGSSSVGLMKGYMLESFDTGKKDDKGKAIMSTKLWDANAIETAGDYSVRFNLKTPQVAIPEHMFHYTNQIVDPSEGFKLEVGSNGSGAFEIVELAVGQKCVLQARKDGWWGEGPYVDRIEFIDHGDDQAAGLAALASKQVDGLSAVALSQVPVLEKIPHVEVFGGHTAQTAVMQMIITEKPFDDPKVRLAMRHAMDAQRVVDLAVQGRGLPAEHHFVAPFHPEYAPLPEMKFDPAMCKKLLADAGYPNGIEVSCLTDSGSAWQKAAVQAMAEMYKQCGINMKIDLQPSSVYWENWDKAALGFIAWGPRPLGIQILALGFRSGVPWNPTGFAHKKFDDLLTKAEGTLDIEKRRVIMKELETIMQQEGPIAQPVWLDLITGYDKKVKGFKMHPAAFVFGWQMAIEA
jgi:peptide/nickel transport system substrate-binding protein